MKSQNLKIYFVSLIVLFALSCKVQSPKEKGLINKNSKFAEAQYFGQKAPTTIPQIFAPGIISKPDRYEFGCTISKDGKEFYFGISNDKKMEIHKTVWKDGQWSPQENIFPNDSCSYNDPIFSNNDDKLYFISNRPTSEGGPLKDIDIWYIQRTNKTWSAPINLGHPINNQVDQYYSSFTNDNSLYFASKDSSTDAPSYAFDIYKSQYVDGQYSMPHKLPAEINTNRYEADVFIAPDESYIIFCSIRRHGMGAGDLYISFKDDAGKWTDAISMGDKINTASHELCPYLSRDGKFLFYTSNEDIYWVSSKIIEELRSNNE